MNRISWICLLLATVGNTAIHGGDPAPKDHGRVRITEADLTALRAQAAKERPAFEAFGWAVYRWESQYYGVYKTKGIPEFIASEVEKTEIRISGPAEMIVDSKKRIAVAEKATAKLRGDRFEISGGRTRVAVEVP